MCIIYIYSILWPFMIIFNSTVSITEWQELLPKAVFLWYLINYKQTMWSLNLTSIKIALSTTITTTDHPHILTCIIISSLLPLFSMTILLMVMYQKMKFYHRCHVTSIKGDRGTEECNKEKIIWEHCTAVEDYIASLNWSSKIDILMWWPLAAQCYFGLVNHTSIKEDKRVETIFE